MLSATIVPSARKAGISSAPSSGSPTQTKPTTSSSPRMFAVKVAWRGAVAFRSRQPRSTAKASSQAVGELGDQGAGSDLVQPELELGDDAEVAAATAQAPEQVGVLGRTRVSRSRRPR